MEYFPQWHGTSHRWRGRPWGQWRPPRSECCCWAWRPSPSSPRAWCAPDPWWPVGSHPMVIIFSQGALWTDWPHLMRWYLWQWPHDVMKTEDVSGELTQGPGIWPLLCYNNLILAHLTPNLLSPLNNYLSSPFRKQRGNPRILPNITLLRSWEYFSLIMY